MSVNYFHILFASVIGFNRKQIIILFLLSFFSVNSGLLFSQVVLENEYKVTDEGLFFDGNKVPRNTPDNNTAKYDYFFGPQISAHGDAIKKHKDFIFTTWYRGDKYDRHMMLSRYNTKTGVLKTIEFPHRHTGYQNSWWIGESHNTIAVGISPLDETIHLLYDMHAYGNSGAFTNDYFRYSYSKKNAATVPDEEFNLDVFVNSAQGNYKHIGLNGVADPNQFSRLTYPRFFVNDNGDLLMHMRRGGNNNGAYVFAKYDAATSTWDNLTQLNHLDASNRGEPYNWGLYGSMKYENGKLRVGFQVRSANNNDKFIYQNGIYYAYSNDQSGKSQWKDHTGKNLTIPFSNPDLIKVFEPGNLVSATGKDEVYIVSGFDWTVTDSGDVHIISQVRDTKNNVTKNVHTYKPADSINFITTTNFAGGTQIYTSANNIYLIGLKNNRPFIQKAEGGKNNFKTIYEPNSGRGFRHGVPYIYDGKLYYYLQENKSATKVPLYVQVIDLDLDSNTTPLPDVSITAPENSATFLHGTPITISADAVVSEGSIEKVIFRINGEDYQEVNALPYSVTWTPTSTGIYTIEAEAFDDKNLNSVSNAINIVIYTDDQTSLYVNFEDENTLNDWQLEANFATTAIVESPYSGRGSNVLKISDFSSNTGFHFKNELIGKVVAKPGDYVHSIIYAASKIEGGQATPSFSSSWVSVTPGFENISTTEMERLTFRRQYPATELENRIIFPRLRSKPGADLTNEIYFDDLVLYVHSSEVTDLIAPEPATNFTIIDQSEFSNEFSWTNGVDALTGVQKTYILRSANTSAEAPVLMPQVGYSVTGGTDGPDTLNNWSIIGIIDAGINNFVNVLENEEAVYSYAIVHRDLAYNYSAALLSSDNSTSIENKPAASQITIYPVPVKQILFITGDNYVKAEVYSISGKKLMESTDVNKGLDVSILTKGLYIVKIADKYGKVSTTKFNKE